MESQIRVRLDQFDGPLALLIYLIQKEQMSIDELDLTVITRQYLRYLRAMSRLNFDIAGDYLHMAATLLHLKSKSCIQTPASDQEHAERVGEITSKQELIRRLELLHRYKRLGGALWELPRRGEDHFVRPKLPRKAIVRNLLTPISLEKLISSMVDLKIRANRSFTMVKRDRISIKEKLVKLKELLSPGEQHSLFRMLEEDPSLDNIVITFISLLELARLQRIELFQNEPLTDIFISVMKSLSDLDVETANGFDEEEPSSPPSTDVPIEQPIDVAVEQQAGENV